MIWRCLLHNSFLGVCAWLQTRKPSRRARCQRKACSRIEYLNDKHLKWLTSIVGGEAKLVHRECLSSRCRALCIHEQDIYIPRAHNLRRRGKSTIGSASGSIISETSFKLEENWVRKLNKCGASWHFMSPKVRHPIHRKSFRYIRKIRV